MLKKGNGNLVSLPPSLLIQKVYDDVKEKEIGLFSTLCGYEKQPLDYNKIFKTRFLIQKFVKLNCYYQRINKVTYNSALVYFVWGLGRINDERKLHLARSIIIFNKRNKLTSNAQYLITPNLEEFTISDVLLPKGRAFLLTGDKPVYKTLAENIKKVAEHYSNFNHYVVLFTDEMKYEHLKFAKEISKFSKLLTIYVKDNALYFLYPNFVYRRIRWKKNEKITTQQ